MNPKAPAPESPVTRPVRLAGSAAFVAALALSQGLILSPFPEGFKAGSLLLFWGWLTLQRMGRMIAAESDAAAGPRQEIPLPSLILGGMHSRDRRESREMLEYASHPALLCVFLPGAVFCALQVWKAVALGSTGYLQPAFCSILCGMGFWIAQGYALHVRQALALAAGALALTALSCAGLAAADRMFLLPAPELPGFAQSEGADADALLTWLSGASCLAVFVRGITGRRRAAVRFLPAAALLFLGAMAVLAARISPVTRGSEALWLPAWAILGAAWAQSWTRARRRARLYQNI